ncbi:hypothetical protein Verru16b_01145 [Lacunisphaera limnophila]|uniref:Uncharacterized protein n=1 Tax=Lacunisphaera limnophila TaxID=1838286 RepID=A0A1D8AT61_9BACT|nr:hypothetical protein Verru16b_01145 [Lacunisphaera limnophila]
MRAKRLLRKASKPSRKVQWEPDFIPWGVGIGLLLGLAAEVYSHGNILWLSGGGLAGGVAGAICDTALFVYRLIRRKRSMKRSLHP